MPPRPSAIIRAAVVAVLLVSTILLAGCGAGASSFDPAAPCAVDQRLPGAYPALEARIPTTLFGAAPSRLDSGRNCSAKNLGTLAGHGVTEVRFAGGLWERSSSSGVTIAVFTGDGVTAERIGEWYEASAVATNKTGDLRPSRPTIAGRQGYRLDLVASEVPQTVIAWPAADGAVVNVVIGAGVPEADVQAAVDALR